MHQRRVETMPGGAQQLIPWLRSSIFDVIDHAIFYPDLRRLGFQPETIDLKDIDDIVKRGDYANSQLSDYDRAVRLFRVYMEVTDKAAVSRFLSWYEARGWGNAMEMANRMYAAAKNSTWTADAELAAFVAAADALFGDRITFRDLGLRSIKAGNTTRNAGVVDMSPRMLISTPR